MNRFNVLYQQMEAITTRQLPLPQTPFDCEICYNFVPISIFTFTRGGTEKHVHKGRGNVCNFFDYVAAKQRRALAGPWQAFCSLCLVCVSVWWAYIKGFLEGGEIQFPGNSHRRWCRGRKKARQVRVRRLVKDRRPEWGCGICLWQKISMMKHVLGLITTMSVP